MKVSRGKVEVAGRLALRAPRSLENTVAARWRRGVSIVRRGLSSEEENNGTYGK
jgi:hypothetical protein